jgi:hypothetical protein
MRSAWLQHRLSGQRHGGLAARQPALRRHSRCLQIVGWPLPGGMVAALMRRVGPRLPTPTPRRLFSTIVPGCTVWILSNTWNGSGVPSN